MPLKPKHRSCCEKYNYTRCPEKTSATKTPKKVLISKKWHQNCCHDVKTKSAGTFGATESAKPNKMSISLPVVPKHNENQDFCKTCGDTDDIETAVAKTSDTVTNKASKTSAKSSPSSKKENKSQHTTQQENKTKIVEEYYKNEKFAQSNSSVEHTKTHKSAKKSIKIKKNAKTTLKTDKREVKNEEVLQEYFLNEKFADLYDSMHDIETIVRNTRSLDTIHEDNEIQASRSGADSNIYILENSDDDSLKRLKEFRDRNYFECHSAKTRITSKCSVTSLKNHKCSYRLYLNERLFPVSIDDDHNDHIRCVECHLPLDNTKLSNTEDKPNGTIQAKVKLGSETRDMVLLLPIKEPLIIKQRRKEKNDNDVVYFGVVRLDQYGGSIFNRALPSDSLALRHQRGYRRLTDVSGYRYDKVDQSDVIII